MNMGPGFPPTSRCFVLRTVAVPIVVAITSCGTEGSLFGPLRDVETLEVVLENADDRELFFQGTGLGSQRLAPGAVQTVTVTAFSSGRVNFSLFEVEPGMGAEPIVSITCEFLPPVQVAPPRRVVWDGQMLACVGWPAG